jgi:hypothetical protein
MHRQFCQTRPKKESDTSVGDEQVSKLKVDTFGEAQYEHSVRFYNELAVELNAIKFGRLKWAPHNTQAVGRFALQRALGVPALLPNQVFTDAGLRV